MHIPLSNITHIFSYCDTESITSCDIVWDFSYGVLMQVAYRWKVLNMLKLYVEKEEGKNFFLQI